MTLDPHIATTAVVTVCAGWFMLNVGLQKSALELRRRRRVCPACGRQVQPTGCCGCR